MRQEPQARQLREGLALGEVGLDRLNGAVAGTDEEFGDARGGELVEDLRQLAETFEDADRNDGSTLKLFGKRQALAAGLAGGRIDDKASAHHRAVIQEVRGALRRAASACMSWTRVQHKADDGPQRDGDQAPIGFSGQCKNRQDDQIGIAPRRDLAEQRVDGPPDVNLETQPLDGDAFDHPLQ